MFSTICTLIAYLVILNISKKMMHKYNLKYDDNPMIYFGDHDFYYLPNKTYTYNALDVDNYTVKLNTNQNKTHYNYM
mgnify:FL=1|jgi:hypothetical protein